MAKYLPIICKVLDLVARTASKKKEEVNYHQKKYIIPESTLQP